MRKIARVCLCLLVLVVLTTALGPPAGPRPSSAQEQQPVVTFSKTAVPNWTLPNLRLYVDQFFAIELELTAQGNQDIGEVAITDFLPPMLAYRPDSTSLRGLPRPELEPEVSDGGRRLTWRGLRQGPGGTSILLRYWVTAISPGEDDLAPAVAQGPSLPSLSSRGSVRVTALGATTPWYAGTPDPCCLISDAGPLSASAERTTVGPGEEIVIRINAPRKVSHWSYSSKGIMGEQQAEGWLTHATIFSLPDPYGASSPGQAAQACYTVTQYYERPGEYTLRFRVSPFLRHRTVFYLDATFTYLDDDPCKVWQYYSRTAAPIRVVALPDPNGPKAATFTLSVDKKRAAPGETLTYTLRWDISRYQDTFTKDYGINKPGLGFSVKLDGLQFLSASLPPYSYYTQTRTLTWVLRDPGTHPTMGYPLDASAPYSPSGTITFYATVPKDTRSALVVAREVRMEVARPWLVLSYPDMVTRLDPVVTWVDRLDLQYQVDKAEASPGQTLTYTARYKNVSSYALEKVVLRAFLDQDTTYVKASAHPTQTLKSAPSGAGGSLVWELGTLPAGAEGQASFQAAIAKELPQDKLAVSSTAQIEASGVSPISKTAMTELPQFSVKVVAKPSLLRLDARSTSPVTSTITVTLTKEAKPLAGEKIAFSRFGLGTLSAQEVTTDSRGQASLKYTSPTYQEVSRLGVTLPVAVPVEGQHVASGRGGEAWITLAAYGIQGSVKDVAMDWPNKVTVDDKIPLPKAQVTATNPSTGETVSTTADDQGRYELGLSSQGTYQVRASAIASNGKAVEALATVEIAQEETQAKVQDFHVPLSLVNEKLALIGELQDLKPPPLTDVDVWFGGQTTFTKRYNEERASAFLNLLLEIARVGFMPYQGVFQGFQDTRGPDGWDALERLILPEAFAQRRFSEAAISADDAVKAISILALAQTVKLDWVKKKLGFLEGNRLSNRIRGEVPASILEKMKKGVSLTPKDLRVIRQTKGNTIANLIDKRMKEGGPLYSELVNAEQLRKVSDKKIWSDKTKFWVDVAHIGNFGGGWGALFQALPLKPETRQRIQAVWPKINRAITGILRNRFEGDFFFEEAFALLRTAVVKEMMDVWIGETQKDLDEAASRALANKVYGKTLLAIQSLAEGDRQSQDCFRRAHTWAMGAYGELNVARSLSGIWELSAEKGHPANMGDFGTLLQKTQNLNKAFQAAAYALIVAASVTNWGQLADNVGYAVFDAFSPPDQITTGPGCPAPWDRWFKASSAPEPRVAAAQAASRQVTAAVVDYQAALQGALAALEKGDRGAVEEAVDDLMLADEDLSVQLHSDFLRLTAAYPQAADSVSGFEDLYKAAYSAFQAFNGMADNVYGQLLIWLANGSPEARAEALKEGPGLVAASQKAAEALDQAGRALTGVSIPPFLAVSSWLAPDRLGETAAITATVRNYGGATANDVKVTLFPEDDYLGLDSPATVTVGTLGAGQEAHVSWRIRPSAGAAGRMLSFQMVPESSNGRAAFTSDSLLGSLGRQAQLRITADFPGTLLVTEYSGARIGFDPREGEPADYLPGASYSGPLSRPQVVTLPDPHGGYRLVLFPQASGPYQVRVELVNGAQVAPRVLEGSANPAEKLAADLFLKLEEGVAALEVGPIRASPMSEKDVPVPTLSKMVPSEGVNDVPNEVAIYGSDFLPGIRVMVGTTALSKVTWVSSIELRATVPAGLVPGTYDVTAINPGSQQASPVPLRYTVVAAEQEDLYMAEEDLWTSPPTVRQGEKVLLGVNVHRQGGTTTLAEVPVDFYLGDPQAGGTLIGRGKTPPLNPYGTDTASVEWTVANAPGDVRIYAVINPAGQIAEGNQANNRASRLFSIAPAVGDVTAPRVTSLVVNGGASSTTSQTVTVEIQGEDPTGGTGVKAMQSTGVSGMYLVEREFNPSARRWVAVQQTGWITYTRPYSLTLAPRGGVRYIQAWVSDQAGNISVEPAKARIDYLPPSDQVARNQIRLYRRSLEAGTALTAVLETLTGDADLYVWSPSGQSWVSNNSGNAEDKVTFTALEAGLYQVEVYGYADSTFKLTVSQGLASSERNVAFRTLQEVNPEKALRTVPIVMASSEPEGQMALPKAPEGPSASGVRLFFPAVMKGAAGGW